MTSTSEVGDHLLVGDGHRLYFEVHGRGIPAVVLHGGPGSGVSRRQLEFFDLDRFRVLLFDQRGAGLSQPAGSLVANTTEHLVADLELLRQAQGIERWVVFGGSWGSTLALAYARRYPQRVIGMVLRGVFLGTAGEVDWFFRGLRRFLPAAWAEFAQQTSGVNLLAAYHAVLTGEDAARAAGAAARWRDWEDAVMVLSNGAPAAQSTGGSAPASARDLNKFRIQAHYLVNRCFLPRPLLREVSRFATIPAVIVQGQHDFVTPPRSAGELAASWRRARLSLVTRGGHDPFMPEMAQALRAGLNELAEIPER